jgi:hypothetical protein
MEKLSKFGSNGPGDYCCCAPPLDVTTFENGYPTAKQLMCSAVSEEIVCNSYVTCFWLAISRETTELSETVCDIDVAQLLQTLHSLPAEHKTPLLWG